MDDGLTTTHTSVSPIILVNLFLLALNHFLDRSIFAFGFTSTEFIDGSLLALSLL
jgi:hypothetical protein